jgi:predicted amidohydrolase YtcJ
MSNKSKRCSPEFRERAVRRPVLIHGQFLREDQLDSFKALGVIPSLFPMHTFYWGTGTSITPSARRRA